MEGSVLSFLKAEWKVSAQAQRTEPLVQETPIPSTNESDIHNIAKIL